MPSPFFSAHGVGKEVENEAHQRGLQVLDATCPLVTKVHNHGRQYAAKGYQVILIGEPDHPEVIGTLGANSRPGSDGANRSARRRP